VKAPEFENVVGFEKEVNALWELKTEIRHSLVFVNFETNDSSSKVHLGNGIRLAEALQIEEKRWVSGWKVDTEINWKLAGM